MELLSEELLNTELLDERRLLELIDEDDTVIGIKDWKYAAVSAAHWPVQTPTLPFGIFSSMYFAIPLAVVKRRFLGSILLRLEPAVPSGLTAWQNLQPISAFSQWVLPRAASPM
jgi:hypothetical protein